MSFTSRLLLSVVEVNKPPESPVFVEASNRLGFLASIDGFDTDLSSAFDPKRALGLTPYEAMALAKRDDGFLASGFGC